MSYLDQLTQKTGDAYLVYVRDPALGPPVLRTKRQLEREWSSASLNMDDFRLAFIEDAFQQLREKQVAQRREVNASKVRLEHLNSLIAKARELEEATEVSFDQAFSYILTLYTKDRL